MCNKFYHHPEQQREPTPVTEQDFDRSVNKIKTILNSLTHLCRPVRSTFAVRETASLVIMGAPRVPPLSPSETIVL